jgi:GNAT superfamily N-acetyltransferase
MAHPDSELFTALGAAARLWATDLHVVDQDWWIALSGSPTLGYNLAASRSRSADLLEQQCLKPLLAAGQPGIIMLSGPGLASAQRLADANWVVVGALPLMLLTDRPDSAPSGQGVRLLGSEDLAAAREVVAITYGLDPQSSLSAIPELAHEVPGFRLWGLFDHDKLISCFSIVISDGLIVGWSMATLPEYQRQGYGRRLLTELIKTQFADGDWGLLLQGSAAGQPLYNELGFKTVDFWQLWSRPRWAMGAS